MEYIILTKLGITKYIPHITSSGKILNYEYLLDILLDKGYEFEGFTTLN